SLSQPVPTFLRSACGEWKLTACSPRRPRSNTSLSSRTNGCSINTASRGCGSPATWYRLRCCRMAKVLLFGSAMVLTGPWLVAWQASSQPERGERIMTAACTGACHDTRPIDTQALDEGAWTKEVRSMIDEGAEVKAEDVPPLVEYLVRFHGPLPDG